MEYAANEITKRERDCLVVLAENPDSEFPLRLHEIASMLGIKPPTALGIVRRLERKGLTESKDGMVHLTRKGTREVSDILLIHRTIETLLCQSGMEKNAACGEAAKVDFLLSEKDAELILNKIGQPKNCPHGKPIRVEM
ncbi:MAG: metal-dependent transcriptional regulator [Thermoplasmatales archaeon]